MALPNNTQETPKKPKLEVVKSVYEKLLEVRKSIPYLQKVADGFQYKYNSSSQVLGSVRAKIDELGLLLIPNIKEGTHTDILRGKNAKGNETVDILTELKMTFTWLNVENPSDTLTCEWYGQGVDTSGEKGVGKALTYSEKYFMLKFFNIATDKDDPDSFQDKITPNDKNITPIKKDKDFNIFEEIENLKSIKEITEFTNKYVNEVPDKGAFIKALKTQREKIGA